MSKKQHIANRIVNQVVYHSDTEQKDRERHAAEFSEQFEDTDVTRRDIYKAVEAEIERIEDDEYTDDLDAWFDDEEVRSHVIDIVVDIVSDNI